MFDRTVRQYWSAHCAGIDPPLEYTGFVHAHLNSFVEGMEKRFPALTQRWRPLTDAVRDEFCMYYELRFSAPSDDSLDLEEGELVKFRKRTDLAFPLPLDTEVFVTLEGTPSTYSSKPITLSGKNLFGEIKIPNNDYGSSFFRVVAHEHEMIDLYGDLSERQFTMILEPLEGWEGVPDKEHFLHLLKVNGWERQD